jgi:hypothetical protein
MSCQFPSLVIFRVWSEDCGGVTLSLRCCSVLSRIVSWYSSSCKPSGFLFDGLRALKDWAWLFYTLCRSLGEICLFAL